MMNIQIPYLDLSIKNQALRKELLTAVDTVLTHGRIILGPEVEEILVGAGIYWDEIGHEYFSIEVFQRETFERLTTEYVSQNYA